nr:molybdopterin-dependent oxidoreductase [Agrilactobacillus composti]
MDSGGKSMVIMGAGINHWFNSDMTYRAIINLVLLTGCEGVSGGGWAHYVGQEKLRPQEGWAPWPLPTTGKLAVPVSKMARPSSILPVINGNMMNWITRP